MTLQAVRVNNVSSFPFDPWEMSLYSSLFFLGDKIFNMLLVCYNVLC